ncbi:MAG: GNAT family N-acetyltransferase [Solirubrobacterales bacterium]
MGPVAVRRAEAADAVEVARLLHDFNSEYEDHTPGVEALAGHYRELLGAGELIVLLAGEGPDGFCQFRFRRSHYTGLPDAQIEELYVVPRLRGRGIGRSLLETTIDLAREAGANHIELTTGEDDLGARSLYESAGFTNREGEPDGPRMLYYEREL